MPDRSLDRAAATGLLRGLVSIPSVSRAEADASSWLVAQMAELGYDRAFVDVAGNAVGELGDADAARTVVLLGHIDTVPGDIAVRVEESDEGPILYGRGSVDAKGPLATFVSAAARLGSSWVRSNGVRIVVVGAVEEEAATSRGARFIRDRFDGVAEPIPSACIIGEPSSPHRVTLGYKGRLLIELQASQPMAHTAGPDAGVATVAVDFWNQLAAIADRYNMDHGRAFDQLSPSLRALSTWTDDRMQDTVSVQVGVRLPFDFDAPQFAQAILKWGADRVGAEPSGAEFDVTTGGTVTLHGPFITLELTFRGYESAWRSDRNTPLVRSFLAAIREQQLGVRPGFVVKTGTSDMNVVGPSWQCPILAYGPGDSALDHTPHEHLHLDEYWQAVLTLERALRNLSSLLP